MERQSAEAARGRVAEEVPEAAGAAKEAPANRGRCLQRVPAQVGGATAVGVHGIDLPVAVAAGCFNDPMIYDERTLDLLHGAAQADDLTRTPAPAVAALGKTIGRIRVGFEFDDLADPRGAAALALAEVIDPSSGVIDVKEVLVRSTWAVVETVEAPGVLRFLLEVDHVLAGV